MAAAVRGSRPPLAFLSVEAAVTMQHPTSLLDLPEIFRHRRRRSIRFAIVAVAALCGLAMIMSDLYQDGFFISRFIDTH